MKKTSGVYVLGTVALLTGSVLAVVGCSSSGAGDGASSAVKISAQLGDGYAVQGKPMVNSKGVRTTSTPEEVDQVWAVPLYNGQMSYEAIAMRKVLPVQADGSFTFEVSPSSGLDHVLVLVNSSECTTSGSRINWSQADIIARRSCIKGYVALEDATTSDSLIGIPTTKMRGDMSLGKLNAANAAEEALPENRGLGDVADRFTFGIDGLRAMARSGAMLKMVKNFYSNFDNTFANGVAMSLYYTYDIIKPEALAEINGNWAVPNLAESGDYPRPKSYWLNLASNLDPVIHHGKMKSEANYGALIPPAPVNHDSGSGLSILTHSSAMTCDVGDPTSCYQGQFGSKIYPIAGNFGFSGVSHNVGNSGALLGLAPAGDWILKMDNANVDPTQRKTLAVYDMSYGHPLVDSKPMIPYPSIRVIKKAGTEIIDRIDLKWFTYNRGENVFEPLADSLAYDIVKNVTIYLVVNNDDIQESAQNGDGSCLRFDMSDTILNASKTSLTMTKDYNFPSNSGSCKTNSIHVGYSVTGTGFDFQWKAPPPPE
jgi:hypothetical protein